RPPLPLTHNQQTGHPLLFLSHCSPPSPTLLPYTTLFRSSKLAPAHLLVADRKGLAVRRYWDPAAVAARPSRLDGPGPNSGAPLIDRKSTRLNSSHVAISYAVFCLKKKNISQQRLRAHLSR